MPVKIGTLAVPIYGMARYWYHIDWQLVWLSVPVQETLFKILSHIRSRALSHIHYFWLALAYT